MMISTIIIMIAKMDEQRTVPWPGYSFNFAIAMLLIGFSLCFQRRGCDAQFFPISRNLLRRGQFFWLSSDRTIHVN